RLHHARGTAPAGPGRQAADTAASRRRISAAELPNEFKAGKNEPGHFRRDTHRRETKAAFFARPVSLWTVGLKQTGHRTAALPWLSNHEQNIAAEAPHANSWLPSNQSSANRSLPRSAKNRIRCTAPHRTTSRRSRRCWARS